MAPHSSTLAWKSPWAEEPGRLQSMGSLRVGHDWATSLSLFTFIGEGNGNPLQCSCLENPREPGGLPSIGSHRVGHDWSDLAASNFLRKHIWVKFLGPWKYIWFSLITAYRNLDLNIILPHLASFILDSKKENCCQPRVGLCGGPIHASLEKEMAIHSSTIAWKIPWTEEPGRLQSMGSQRVRHDWATSLIHANRQRWLITFL